MDEDSNEPALVAVAGCLFEVSLPGDESTPWRCDAGGPAMTLLADGRRHGRHHFRFRAEAAAAAAGEVELRFFRGPAERTVTVRVAAEEDLGW
jgi:hypothetical protein